MASLLLPSFYINDACLRLEKIANSLDRHINGVSTINLDLTLFNYNDILNNMRLAFKEMFCCSQYINGSSFDIVDAGYYTFDNLMKEYEALKGDSDNLDAYVKFAKKVTKTFDEYHCARRMAYDYTLYHCGTRDFSFNNTLNLSIFKDNLNDLIQRANRSINVLDMNVQDGALGHNLKCEHKDKVNLYGIKYDDWSSVLINRSDFTRLVKTTFDVNNYHVSNNAFDITILNCIYRRYADSTSASLLDKPELKLLKRAINYTQPGGLIIVEIYKSRLFKDIVSTIVRNMDNVRIYDNTVQIKRIEEMNTTHCLNDCVTIIGIKKKEQDKEADMDIYNKIQGAAFANEYDDCFSSPSQKFDDYVFPPTAEEVVTFRGSVIDEDEITEAYLNTQSYREFEKSQQLDNASIHAQKSLLPFSVGQLGIILTSGCLDGLVDEGDNKCHVVKGRIIKDKSTEIITDVNTHTTEYHDTYNNRVEINAFLPNGKFKRLA